MTDKPHASSEGRERLRSRRLSLALLILAFGFRLALSYPAHRYPADADCSLSALCAFDVLQGRAPVFFPGGVRLGAASCYLTAGLFGAFGVSRATHALGPVLVGWATVLVWFAFYRELLGDRSANVALAFIAIPAAAFTFWTYMPNAYPEVLFACATILWLAARVDRRGPTLGGIFTLGAAVGFGVWASLQTLTCSIPALAWLALGDRRAWASPRRWAAGFGGALIGGAPWIAYNVVNRLGTFRSNFAARPVTGLGAMLSNADYLARYQLPELLASLGSPVQSGVAPALAHRLGPVVLLLISFAALWAWFGPSTVDSTAPAAGQRSARRLLLAVAAVIVLFDIASEAATYRGLSVRYILPLYLLVPGILALAETRVAQRWRLAAAVAAAVILGYSMAGSRLPGTPWRASLEDAGRRDAQLIETLRANGVDVVVGPYWTVYSINFLGHPDLQAIPLDARADPRGVERTVAARPARVALLGSSPEQVRELVTMAGVEARPLGVEGVDGAVIEGRQDVASLVARLRAVGSAP